MPKIQNILKLLHLSKNDLRNHIKINRDAVIFLACLAISSTLWLLNSLNKTFVTELNYPIRYTNLPKQKIPTKTLPTEIKLEVESKGFILIRYHLTTIFRPIIINLDTYKEYAQTHGNITKYILETKNIKENISSHLASDTKVIQILPERLILQFANATQKKVAVRPILDYTLRKQYILSDITITPDSILVYSNDNILDTLNFIPTQILKLKNAHTKLTKNIELQPIEGCNYQQNNVEIQLDIESFTEIKQKQNITYNNVPDSVRLISFPSTIEISYNVGLSKYKLINKDNFVISVDYPKDLNTNFLYLKIEKQPPYVSNIELSSDKVEYIIEKKQ